jgi:hypothetical protein
VVEHLPDGIISHDADDVRSDAREIAEDLGLSELLNLFYQFHSIGVAHGNPLSFEGPRPWKPADAPVWKRTTFGIDRRADTF